SLSIPVIASINCSDISTWEEYISAFESAGADAFELNYYPLAQDRKVTGEDVDKALLKFAKKIRKSTKLPVSIKLGYKYSSTANIIAELDKIGINGLVLFNRFFRPDIDIEKESMTSSQPLSGADEYAESLRWIALMSNEIKCDLAASTGVHSGGTVIKMLLAGAAACEVCTAYLKDEGCIKAMCEDLSSWMDRKGYGTIEAFRGKMAQERMEDGSCWERTQYMKTLINGGR
ncbi:MAG: dihydroorotate oxidase, partial [Bullifex sp.]